MSVSSSNINFDELSTLKDGNIIYVHFESFDPSDFEFGYVEGEPVIYAYDTINRYIRAFHLDDTQWEEIEFINEDSWKGENGDYLLSRSKDNIFMARVGASDVV